MTKYIKIIFFLTLDGQGNKSSKKIQVKVFEDKGQKLKRQMNIAGK